MHLINHQNRQLKSWWRIDTNNEGNYTIIQTLRLDFSPNKTRYSYCSAWGKNIKEWIITLVLNHLNQHWMVSLIQTKYNQIRDEKKSIQEKSKTNSNKNTALRDHLVFDPQSMTRILWPINSKSENIMKITVQTPSTIKYYTGCNLISPHKLTKLNVACFHTHKMYIHVWIQCITRNHWDGIRLHGSSHGN